MAQQIFAVDLNLNGNQLLGVKLEVLASDPTGPDLYQGRVWFNSSTNVVKYYNGTTTVTVGVGVVSVAAGDSTITIGGTGTAPTVAVAKTLDHTYITDFDTQVRTSRLDQLAAPTADVSLASHKLTNVTDPTNPQDAATKAYSDLLAQGVQIQTACRVLATTNQASLSGLPTIDGVGPLTNNDRVLLTGQTTGSQNGPWVVHSGAWTRPTDYATAASIPPNRAYFVMEGTAWADTGWTLTNNAAITVDTTATTWTQFTGLGDVTAGTGLSKSGNTLSLVVPVTVANGGTNATTAAAARTNLGVPGTYAVNVPSGSTTATITHSLGTTDVLVQVQELTGSKRIVGCEVDITDANTVTLGFNVAPTVGQYRVVVHG